jgi:signal transduction histidine kinase
LLLLSLGWWGLTGIRRAEQRSIWVGMALETAHQLGTPLSSLMGWIERLRSQADSSGGDEVKMSRAEVSETVDEMERDVERLRKVAQRFSHVGSTPRLEKRDIGLVVRQAVEYARRRLPRRDGEVEIEERYETVPELPCNRELLEWVIENLLSNAVSALDKRPGRIEVVVSPGDDGGVEIEVRDNGRGMSPTEQRRAFEPGYTTKRRGWGLGLALSQRVVEEYHGGRLYIRRSIPGEGTVVVIALRR